jgi:tRNA pseudouridine38-40 synthase
MTVAYDGSDFHGFAAQPNVVTVGGTLAGVLERVLNIDHVALSCAGRTDAGVHAWGQVVTFDAGIESPRLDEVQQAVNRLCGPRVVVRSIEAADPGFDARFSARARTYRYTVLNRTVPDPFLAATSWHVPVPLDVRAMTMACDPLIGEHDFSSFCRRPKVAPDAEPVSLGRRVLWAEWDDAGDGVLHFWITASAFCHQMVRSITGTLVEVGRGRRRAGDMTGLIAARDRQGAGDLAPAHGLCLWHVDYR